jgi:hypothetical protein
MHASVHAMNFMSVLPVSYSPHELDGALEEGHGPAYDQSSNVLRHLALCHSVITDPRTNKYNASSPDE